MFTENAHRPGLRRHGSAVRLDTSLELLLGHAPQGDASAVLATLVSTVGSTYRKAGARMLILADGGCLGLLSGGCLEADLGLHARDVAAQRVARAVEYDMRGPDDVLFGMGAGCEGVMRVLLEPASAGLALPPALCLAGRMLHAGQATTLIMVHESADLALGSHAPDSLLPAPLRAAVERALATAASQDVVFHTAGRRTRAFVQYLAPAPHLLVCGAGPDATPVVAAAVGLGWRVTVVDHRPAFAVAARFPGAEVRCADARRLSDDVALEHCHAAVVMSHHLPSDVDYLRVLARAGRPEFVGLLGPSARRLRIVQELGALADGIVSRLRGPVGTDIGAVTPEGIALSIVNQIHGWLAGRSQ